MRMGPWIWLLYVSSAQHNAVNIQRLNKGLIAVHQRNCYYEMMVQLEKMQTWLLYIGNFRKRMAPRALNTITGNWSQIQALLHTWWKMWCNWGASMCMLVILLYSKQRLVAIGIGHLSVKYDEVQFKIGSYWNQLFGTDSSSSFSCYKSVIYLLHLCLPPLSFVFNLTCHYICCM